MSHSFIECPYCGTLLPEHFEHCGVCGESLIIASIICVSSSDEKKLPHGKSWLLFPRSYTAGKAENNDIHLDISSRFEFAYKDRFFYFHKITQEDIIGISEGKKLKNGDTINAGGFSLKISYITDFEAFSQYTADAFRDSLSFLYLIIHFSRKEDIYKAYVDTILRMTGLERGYLFKVTDNADTNQKFKLKTARSASGKDLDGRTYPISRSFLKKASESNGNIIMVDTDTTTKLTRSVKDLKLKSIVCCPMLDTECQLKGIFYTDSLKKIKRKKLFYFRPLLKIISDATVKRLEEI